MSSKEQRARWQRNYRKNNLDRVRLSDRQSHIRRYALTPEEVTQRVEAQAGKCEICGKECFEKRLGKPIRALCIDHNRSCCSGRGSCGQCIRGLICKQCNRILGMLEDNIEILERMIDYLKNAHWTPTGAQ